MMLITSLVIFAGTNTASDKATASLAAKCELSVQDIPMGGIKFRHWKFNEWTSKYNVYKSKFI